MAYINITAANYEQEVLKAEKKVLLDFWAPWCGPCKMIAPIVEEIAEEYDDVILGKVNVDEEGQLAAMFKIASIPTLLVFEGGKQVNKAIGYLPKAGVLKLLGKVPFERETSFLVDSNSNAKVLTIGESYPTEGNWAGFPPHKHDEDNMPTECIAEEIYYFLYNPQQGFGIQCLYTADGEIDETYRVKNDELVELPKGYHATVSTPGYETYFLWLMAGDYQGFNRSSDPDHAWIEQK